MGKILADSVPLLENLLDRRGDRRRGRVVPKVGMNSCSQVQDGRQDRAARGERGRRIGGEAITVET